MELNERDGRTEHILLVARQIMTAGRTAPKGKGIDIIEITTLIGDDKSRLAQAMREVSKDTGMMFFLRDADNLDSADAVILVGTKSQTMGLNCKYCGFSTCAQKLKYSAVPCAINSMDVGIAVGSMCSMAADLRVDSRVMFSPGFSASKVGMLEGCSNLLAIPISISSKNPFFDRKSTR